MSLSTEQQVELVASILSSLSSELWAPQSRFRQVLPCSFADLTAWTQSMPDPAVHATLAEAFRRLPLLEALDGFDPMALEGLNSLDPSDPRISGFIAQIQASWPAPEQIDGILQLYECLVRVMRGMIVARPQLPKDSPVAGGLDQAAALRGVPLTDIDSELTAMRGVFEWVRSVRPDVTRSLRIASVRAPDINFLFDLDGSIVISEDFVAPISLRETSGSGFLQSRVWPAGQPGTPGHGLTAYLYRIFLGDVVGDAKGQGISRFEIEVGMIESLNYDDDPSGTRSDVFVITQGGLGSIAPSVVEQSGNMLSFSFDPPILVGVDAGRGDGTFFFGFASQLPARPQTGRAIDLMGEEYPIECRTP